MFTINYLIAQIPLRVDLNKPIGCYSLLKTPPNTQSSKSVLGVKKSPLEKRVTVNRFLLFWQSMSKKQVYLT